MGRQALEPLAASSGAHNELPTDFPQLSSEAIVAILASGMFSARGKAVLDKQLRALQAVGLVHAWQHAAHGYWAQVEGDHSPAYYNNVQMAGWAAGASSVVDAWVNDRKKAKWTARSITVVAQGRPDLFQDLTAHFDGLIEVGAIRSHAPEATGSGVDSVTTTGKTWTMSGEQLRLFGLGGLAAIFHIANWPSGPG